MFGLNKDQFLGFLRHVITFVGGVLVARGKLDPLAVESIGGALITIVGLFFSATTPEKAATVTTSTTSTSTTAPPPPTPVPKV